MRYDSDLLIKLDPTEVTNTPHKVVDLKALPDYVQLYASLLSTNTHGSRSPSFQYRMLRRPISPRRARREIKQAKELLREALYEHVVSSVPDR